MQKVTDGFSEAKRLLRETGCTCVSVKDGNALLSKGRGISPLLSALLTPEKFSGSVFADTVVGRAAAFLYVKLGAKAIYAAVLESEAKTILEKNGITVEQEICVKEIINRKGTGPCPMNTAVKDTDEADEAYEILASAYDGMAATWETVRL